MLLVGAIVYASFLWWFSTGVIFYLNARPAHTFPWSMMAATLVLALALYGLWAAASMQGMLGAYLSFTCGVLIWGWHTMSYYMGIITGPRQTACPPGSRGFSRFVSAVATSIYHELAIVGTVALMIWLTWGQPNLVGLWTFLLLWGMHVSAKLNVYLGVRNLNVEFIPQRLQYLTTYFRQRSMNLLFPLSVSSGTVIALLLAQAALANEPGTLAATGYVLLATLMALAVIEHWFMILPIPAEALWRWSLKPADQGKRSSSAAGTSSAAQRSPADVDSLCSIQPPDRKSAAGTTAGSM